MDSITSNKLEHILSGNGLSQEEFNEVIDLIDLYANDYHQRELKKIGDIGHVSGIPVARVKHWNDKTEEVEYGTLKETRLHTYLVIPDVDLTTTVAWDKVFCDVQA